VRPQQTEQGHPVLSGASLRGQEADRRGGIAARPRPARGGPCAATPRPDRALFCSAGGCRHRWTRAVEQEARHAAGLHRCMHMCLCEGVMDDDQLERVAELFKALGTVSRLRILTSLAASEGTVGSLVQATGLSQPLVSQHLRLLRSMNLVTVSRSGREATYTLTDDHVVHVIDDAIAHTVEASPATSHSHSTTVGPGRTTASRRFS